MPTLPGPLPLSIIRGIEFQDQVLLCVDENDDPVDLTNYTVQAEVRRTSNADLTLDLNPSITDAANGEITIPGISSEDTQDFDFVGTFRWDLVLINGSSERVGVFLTGPFVVSDNISHIAPS